MVAVRRVHAMLPIVQPGRTRLMVVRSEKAQDCSTCQMMRRCWETGPRYVAINLLICRMHRNINRDRSTRQLLGLLKPKIGRITQNILRSVGPAITPDPSEVEADVRAAIVEYLLGHYQMGELAFPLYFLFGGKSGVMYRWSLAYASRIRKAWKNTYPMGSVSTTSEGSLEDRLDRLQSAATTGIVGSWSGGERPGEREAALAGRIDRKKRTRLARAVVDDGASLPLDEYRIMAFCMANANERGRPINGLHAFMSARMGVVRSRVTRLFHDAGRRLVAAEEQAS